MPSPVAHHGCAVVLYGARVLRQTCHGASHAVMLVCGCSCDKKCAGCISQGLEMHFVRKFLDVSLCMGALSILLGVH